MKNETVSADSAVSSKLLESGGPALADKAVAATSLENTGAAKQSEAKDLEAVEALEHRYYPTELSDEELMNLDFAGC